MRGSRRDVFLHRSLHKKKKWRLYIPLLVGILLVAIIAKTFGCHRLVATPFSVAIFWLQNLVRLQHFFGVRKTCPRAQDKGSVS